MTFRRMIAGLVLATLILGGLACSDNKSSQPPTATIPLQGPPKAAGGGAGDGKGPNAPAPKGGASAF